MADFLPLSPQVDIIRAFAKDEEYINLLHANLQEVLTYVLPNVVRSRADFQGHTLRLVRFLYHAFTPVGVWTGKTNSKVVILPVTPGEEYASTLRVRGDRVLSARVRILLAALYSIGRRDVHSMLKVIIPPWVVDTILKCHLMVFYWSGQYYTIADRLLRINRLQTSATDTPPVGVRILAVAIAAQIITDAARYAAQRWRAAVNRHRAAASVDRSADEAQPQSLQTTHPIVSEWKKTIARWISGYRPDQPASSSAQPDPTHDSNSTERTEVSTKKCTLCLEQVHHPTVTRCGHVFCWDCICNWCSSNEICPLCRQGVAMQTLVCLYNY